MLYLGWVAAVERSQPAQRPAYEVRLNPVYSISNHVAGSNHHEVFRRTTSIVLQYSLTNLQRLRHFIRKKVWASMPACLRIARNVASGMSPGGWGWWCSGWAPD
jgi:hypothetical protein